VREVAAVGSCQFTISDGCEGRAVRVHFRGNWRVEVDFSGDGGDFFGDGAEGFFDVC